jgi:hypothetical protein
MDFKDIRDWIKITEGRSLTRGSQWKPTAVLEERLCDAAVGN